jgi:hypothetical protein
MDIVLDFDGTVLTHDFPNLGKDIGAVPVLKKIIANGHRLILFTMRSDGQEEQNLENGYKIHKGDFLTQAVDWFKEYDIPLFGIQRNPEQDIWTSSPKAYGQLIIDDAALGAPLKYAPSFHSRPFMDWEKVELILIEQGYIK